MTKQAPAGPQDHELLDVREAAQLLRVGRNQVYAWAKTNQLPCIRWGRRYRFPRHVLLKWIDTQTSPERLRA